MTGFGQVVHVMKKDLREARWLLAVYVGIVALATAHAVGLGAAHGEIFGFTTMLLILFGMIVVGSIVQGDSPIRADAFWATRPLYPSAVLLAKFALTLIVVIGVAEIGQLAGLVAHHVPTRDLAGTLAESIGEYSRWLLIAMVFAAVTRDLRTFLLVLVAIPAYYLFTAIAYSSTELRALGPAHPTAAKVMATIGIVTFAAGGVGLLFYLYRTRDARSRTWTASTVVFAAGMGVFAMFTAPIATEVTTVEQTVGPDGPTIESVDVEPPVGSETAASDAPPTVRRAVIKLVPKPDTAGATPDEELPLRIHLEMDSLPVDTRLTLIGAVAVYHMRDGTVLRERIRGEWNPTRYGMHAATAITWLDAHPQHPSMDLTLVITDSLKRAFERGVTTVGLDGRVLVSVPDFADTMPLQIGASTADDGERTTVTKLSYRGAQATLTVSTSGVDLGFKPEPQSFIGAFNAYQVEYAIVNEVRLEAFPLVRGDAGTQSGWLVLPGAMTHVSTARLDTPSRFYSGGKPLDDAWFRDARLVITHWVSRGSYPVHSEIAVPARASMKKN